METYLGKQDSLDRESSERNVTVWRGRKRGHESCSDRSVCGALKVVQKDVEQSSAGRTEFLDFQASVQAVFVQLPHESAVSLRMCSTDSVWLFQTVGQKNKKTLNFVNAEKGVERVFETTR